MEKKKKTGWKKIFSRRRKKELDQDKLAELHRLELIEEAEMNDYIISKEIQQGLKWLND